MALAVLAAGGLRAALMAEALISLLVAILVVSRAVNILR